MLAANRTRTAVSVGLLPTKTPRPFTEMLQRMATFYGRLARPDTWQGRLYFGQQTLPPDAFAVDAERVFTDFARRYIDGTFVARIQVSAAPSLPPGLAEMLGSLVSPGQAGVGSHLDRDRVSAAYHIRIPRGQDEEQLARWNLEGVDFILLPGDEEIWARPDPPPAQLRALCVLADAKDASSAFRLPAAVDGTVPGFRVRRGGFGQEESLTARGTFGRTRDAARRAPGARGAEQPDEARARDRQHRKRQDDHDPGAAPPTVAGPWDPVPGHRAGQRGRRRLPPLPARARFRGAQVITAGDEGGRPLRFNPFEVPKNVLVAEHAANLLACFKAAFGLWEPLPSIYQDALNLTYLRAGILASQRSERARAAVAHRSRVRPGDVAGDPRPELRRGGAGQHRGRIRTPRPAAGLRRQRFGLPHRPATHIEDLLSHPVVLELKSLGSGDDQAPMMALLLNGITEDYQARRGASPELIHVTVIEEAHRFPGPPGSGTSRGGGSGQGESRRGVRQQPGREPQVRRGHRHRGADPHRTR